MRDPVGYLRAEGCIVRVVAGYATRHNGGSAHAPIGVMIHHTASSKRGGDAPALGICTKGRADLSGPLCNLHIARSGPVSVVALGSANHAGKGSRVVLNEVKAGRARDGSARSRGLADSVGGNAYFIGIEVENDGIGEVWSPVLIDAVVRVVTGLCRMYGWDSGHVIEHSEWSRRKPDTSFHGGWRALVQARLNGKASPVVTPAKAAPPKGVAYLEQGSKGATVVALQKKLGILADGDFGPATKAAVIKFQKSKGLVGDGVVGPATLAALSKAPEPKFTSSRPAPKPINKVAPPVKKPPTWWKRTLQIGAVGADVKRVQALVGLKGAAVDGDYGPATKAAVARWQKAKGLTPDGEFGPKSARLA